MFFVPPGRRPSGGPKRARDGAGKRLAVLVHHTDAGREWAEDRKSPIGRLDKALDEAQRRGRTVVDMKRDWKVTYPFEKP